MQELVECATHCMLEQTAQEDVARVGVCEPLARPADRPLAAPREVEQVGRGPVPVGFGDHEFAHGPTRGDAPFEVVGDSGGVGEEVVHGRLARGIRGALRVEQTVELVAGEECAHGRVDGEGAGFHELHDQDGRERLADARDVEAARAVAGPVIDAESRRRDGHLRGSEDAAASGDAVEMAVEARGEVGGCLHLRESLDRVSKRDVAIRYITSRSIWRIALCHKTPSSDGEANAWET